MRSNKRPLFEDLSLEPFVPADASEELWNAYFEISESVFSEFNPKARKPERNVSRRLLTAPSSLYAVKRTVASDKNRTPVAYASMGYDTESSPSYEIDRHVCRLNIMVAKPFRRLRVATNLLRCLLDQAEGLEKNTVAVEADNRTGIAFCDSLEGTLVHKEVKHRLYMESADWQTAREWMEKGRNKFPDTKFEFFRECPDCLIEDFCEVYTRIINERPTGEMEQTIVTTPESRRVEEQNAAKRGIEWYSLVSREENGEISGVTDVMYNPKEPHRIDWYFTGVSAKHRRKGLAKRLKAEMLMAVKEKFPDVEYMTTSMAHNNRPMQAINSQLGFKSRKTCHVYQWELAALRGKVDAILSSPRRRPKTEGRKDSH